MNYIGLIIEMLGMLGVILGMMMAVVTFQLRYVIIFIISFIMLCGGFFITLL